jgi:N-acetyl-anhydromuramyl-L-alanine amidase AmpD
MRNKPIVVITHHTGGTDANPMADTSHHTVQIVNEAHKQRWPTFISGLGWHVGYHYFIDKAGNVVKTREEVEEGAHCIGMNRSSIGVCFAGNFDATLPTQQQINAWNRLYANIQLRYPAIPTHPHRKYATKSCHGRRLSDDYFAQLNQRTALLERIRQLRLQLASLLTNRRMR